MTEIYGEAGVGKTQFCLQLCSNVQLPRSIGGLQGACVYVDCCGGFNSKRLQQICKATQDVAMKHFKGKFNLMDGILFKRVHSIEELIKCLDELVMNVLSRRPDVKLLIIDSIAFHFRFPMLDGQPPNINATLHGISQKLHAIAHNWKMAVILTNQMTTKVVDPTNGGDMACDGDLIPALGESWSHACPTSIHLKYSEQSRRKLVIVKSPSIQCGEANFVITGDGIRDAPPSPPATAENTQA